LDHNNYSISNPLLRREAITLTEINIVVVLGAGAMGAAYASRFYDMDPANISFAASGDRYQRINSEGLIVNDRHYAISAISPEDASPPADLIIVALKHHHLATALPELKNQVSDNTVFLSIMNGLDSEPIIGSVYGEDKVVYATAVGIDAQRAGNVVNYSKGGTIYFGEAENTILTERVKSIQALFERGGIDYKTPTDMIRIMWWKFMINVGINQPSAVLSAPYGVFQTSTHAQQIMESAMREALLVAKAAGVDLSEKDIQEWYTFMNTLDPEGKTSMLQDIEAGRVTEVDIFAGKVIELGKTYSVPTPVNEFLFHAIKVLEQRARQDKI
jgi:2-dehydropantoate 2-reductase